MRKVLYKKWINGEFTNIPNGKLYKEGTNCFDKDYNNKGIFHQWAAKYEEFCEGPVGNYTVAIVENADGTIEEVLPSNIKFIEPILNIK